MPQLPKAREVVRVAHKLGFVFVRQKGSHVSVHGGREISPAVFHRILEDMGITAQELWGF